MARWVVAQRQETSAKMSRKHAPIMTSPTRNLKTKTKKMLFKSKLEDLPNPYMVWTAL